MKLKDLSVFFPAYNEQDNIVKTVENALGVVPSLARDFEILVINDGSSDQTVERLKESGVLNKVRIITHEVNKGYGAALKTGFANSKYGYVFFTDGDGQFDISELEKLVSLIQGCDIAIGYRIKRKDPLFRIINAKAYNLLIRILFGLNVRDIDCAFKLIKKESLDSLVLESNGAFISAELLIRARKKGFVIKECGVKHFEREKGKATGNNPGVVIRAFADLFRLWEKLRK